ncbi:protein argonaute 4A-like [Vitis riparia]|uniref:protein argonaute 4A-like n=1 Tax=Vitis riparia TaxID=96939 RepID=UPI00155A07B9|nr:protein argonaute 4A-like [Vitis riparia]
MESQKPPNAEPAKRSSSIPNRLPMARRGLGRTGETIQLVTNHFKVSMHSNANTGAHFYQYNVSLAYEDGHPADAKDIGRKVMDKVHETYHTEMAGMSFAYDGEKSLFTIGSLPSKKLRFTVVLEDASSNRISTARNIDSPDDGSDRKRSRRPYHSKTFNVEISFAAKFPMDSIVRASYGQPSKHLQDAARVLDIILRQHAAKKGCLVVRQSFFDNLPRNFTPLGGGVLGCRGFNSSFRATQGGLFLNMDVSTTLVIQPDPVRDFLVSNQNVKDMYHIDWSKAKRMLKNLRVKTLHSNAEWKISGLSENTCRNQTFLMKQRNEGPDGGEVRSVEVTVYDYFVKHRKISLQYSGDFPCINVGRSKRPVYIPLELCTLVSLQRYTKPLSTQQRSSLVEKSRQKPQERMQVIEQALKSNKYDANPMLRSSGISISTQFTQVEGRILPTPSLKSGNGQDLSPRNGRWNFNNKELAQPSKIDPWLIASFSSRCNMKTLIQDLIKCAKMKGISMGYPAEIFTENPQYMQQPAPVRVDKMISTMKSQFRRLPQFILCILPQKKNCDIYGPWKRQCLSGCGVPTQCIAPSAPVVNDQYLTNVLLKINAKLGGLNSLLTMGYCPSLRLISTIPTLILGMDVSHGSPGRADVPSIAAVVSSRHWPSISQYKATVRTQSPKLEMIDSLFEPLHNSEDSGIIRGALLDFYKTSAKRKPEQIIIFRDGVGESQFNQVLNIELEQIIEACKLLDEQWHPKFMVIIAQKNHHTRFFQNGSPSNVPPGTIVDNTICHPTNNDFYLCAHAGMIGTSRPTHYHVLLDELGFSADDLQQLVHSLCYVYQRSTTAVSLVAPVCYAHLAAAQVAQFIKFEDLPEPSSGHAAAPVPQLPSFHEKVADTMFFC